MLLLVRCWVILLCIFAAGSVFHGHVKVLSFTTCASGLFRPWPSFCTIDMCNAQERRSFNLIRKDLIVYSAAIGACSAGRVWICAVGPLQVFSHGRCISRAGRFFVFLGTHHSKHSSSHCVSDRLRSHSTLI